MARLMERLQKVDNDSPTDSATDSQPDKVSVLQNLLFFVTDTPAKQARMFDPGKPCLMLASKAGEPS